MTFWDIIAIGKEPWLKKQLAQIPPLFAKQLEKACKLCDDVSGYCSEYPSRKKEFVETGLTAFDRYAWTRPELVVHFSGKLLAICGDNKELQKRCVERFLSRFPGKCWHEKETQFFLETLFRGLGANHGLKGLCIDRLLSRQDVREQNPYEARKILQAAFKVCERDKTLRPLFFDAVLTFASNLDPAAFETQSFSTITFSFGRGSARAFEPAFRGRNRVLGVQRRNIKAEAGKRYCAYAQQVIGFLLKAGGQDEDVRPRIMEAAFSVYFKMAPRDRDAGRFLLEKMAASARGDSSLFARLAGTTKDGGVVVFSGLRAADNPLSVYMKEGLGGETIITGCFSEEKTMPFLTPGQRRNLGVGSGAYLKDFLAAARKLAARPEQLLPLSEAFEARRKRLARPEKQIKENPQRRPSLRLV